MKAKGKAKKMGFNSANPRRRRAKASAPKRAHRRVTLKRSAKGRFLPRAKRTARRAVRAVRGFIARHRPARNPHRSRRRVTSFRKRPRSAALVFRNPYTGEMMPMATVVNPRRRRRRSRRNPGLVAVNRRRKARNPRRRRARRNPGLVSVNRRRRSRRNPGLVAVNRRRRKARNPRRRHHRGRARRNPGMGSFMGAVKGSLPIAMGGVAGGAVAGFIDTKLLTGRPTMSILAKFGLAVVAGMATRRRFPGLSNGLVGGLMGSIGYSVGVKMGGGMVAHDAAGAIKGLGDMAGEDQALTNLLSGAGFGVLLEGLGDGSVQQYLSGDDDMLAGGGNGGGAGAGEGDGIGRLGVLLQ
jgi:hypothetical protein